MSMEMTMLLMMLLTMIIVRQLNEENAKAEKKQGKLMADESISIPGVIAVFPPPEVLYII